MRTRQGPTTETIRAAVELARRAPSVHNSQPWRWRLSGNELHLHADQSRHLTATDPDQRALTLSCGAALHHLRVTLAAQGWSTEVAYLPHAQHPDHLATLRLAPHHPTSTDISLTAAILHRHSDRRRFGNGQVPKTYLRAATDYAVRFGAQIHPIPDETRDYLGKLLREAVTRHHNDAHYQIELSAWSGRRGGADGVPARNATTPRPTETLPTREFADPVLIDTPLTDDADWLLLSTPTDTPRTRLQAGETLSALLLAATDLGLATCIQTEPLGIPDLREEIRFSLCDGAFPQAMVRAGWMRPSAPPLPSAPRREVEAVLSITDSPAN
ncbi:Acg family FMN-binding oxidoreductase [Nocardia inohanensis]|uniref:Acg family FMN-binding oxidoreductase n=1 Tax=Nocardia inohanensis TaxID=209246 RepID=UPI00082D91B3|nr:hypothetical protein [Nocardia inohanensis]